MSRRGVIISGASSGIGAASALRLARDGYVVFAGTRNDADARAVAALHSGIEPVRLDVTDESTIATSVERIRASGIPLYATINNAGIAVGGPLEFLPMARLRGQFEVNVFGAIALTQATLPLLRATKGRIVTIGSIASRLAAPFMGPYSASKSAIAALTHSMRQELASSGIAVSLFEFAAVKTPIWQKGRELREALVRELPLSATERYGEVIESIRKQIDHEERVGIDPALIADAIAGSLASHVPREVYLIGAHAKIQAVVAQLPPSLRDRLVRQAMGLG